MSMKEHYKRLLSEMAQTWARGQEMARDIQAAQKRAEETQAIRDKLFQDLQDIGGDPDYDPNTHLDHAAVVGNRLAIATLNHRKAIWELGKLEGRHKMEQESSALYDVGGKRVVTPRARRPEAAARSQRASRRSRGNIREDLQTPERAAQTTREVRRLGREATRLGKISDEIHKRIYGVYPQELRTVNDLAKLDWNRGFGDIDDMSFPDSVDDYVDAKIAQSEASKRARREREHPTNIYGLGGKIVGTLAAPATGVGREKTAKAFVGKKTATTKPKPKPKASAKKPVKSFKKRLEEALLGESRFQRSLRVDASIARKKAKGITPSPGLVQAGRVASAAVRRGDAIRIASARRTGGVEGAEDMRHHFDIRDAGIRGGAAGKRISDRDAAELAQSVFHDRRDRENQFMADLAKRRPLGESGGPEQHERIENAIFQKGYSDVNVDRLIAASERLRGNIRGRKARRLGPQPFSFGASQYDGTPASLQQFQTIMPLSHGDWREAGGVSSDEIVAAARAGAHPNMTPDLAAEIMRRRLAGLGKAGGGVDNPTFFKDLRRQGLLGPTVRQARERAQSNRNRQTK